MSEMSLYRKYRPQTFKEVVGQDHITSVLARSLQNKTFAHAYLFSGSRGTGKTSVARIFARELGTEGHDLYEMDAASNRGIDDIRELREGVHTQPYSSPYKVYVIDEVHMLSKDAFNALLKTLEEPPPHVVFILATTELDKIPETILSRCTHFHFKQPTVDMLSQMVLSIAKKENLGLSKDSAELIAILGDGSFRDAVSVLQKASSLSREGKVSDDEVSKILGAPKTELISSFLSALAQGNLDSSLEIVEKTKDAGIDMRLFHRLIVARLRAVLLLRFGNAFLKHEVAKSHSTENLAFLEDLAKSARGINADLLKKFLDIEPDIAVASVKTLPLELLLIELFGKEE
jgi:DNA polymerase-3 subunit gamma/tau